MKKALITGITGQDGAYLAAHLLSKGYMVFGSHRRTASINFWRIKELEIEQHENFKLVELDITDNANVIRVISSLEPDEVYNLAAQSFVGVSFEQPITTSAVTGLAPLNILEAIRIVNPNIKFYQASTSEMFGKVVETPQLETTPFYPRSPYGVAKLFAHWMVKNYRESYGLFAANGILFNHESPLRGLEFVTRKITHGVARIALGKQNYLELGNIDSKRDWGYAGDYVDGMHKILLSDRPDDFILATNRTETVRTFVTMAFKAADIEIEFDGTGVDEIARIRNTDKIVMRINSKFFRPSEVDLLIGNPSKARKELNWEPKTSLEEICYKMVGADLKRVETNTSF